MRKPSNPNFSSGPCSKPPNWKPEYNINYLGRSHRSNLCLQRIQYLISKMRKILKIPSEYQVAIVGGSSTGATEMLLWSLLGYLPIDIVESCLFSRIWARDIINELRIENVNEIKSSFGSLGSLSSVNFDNDVVFCWTGTTSGVAVNHLEWIPENRHGLTICDLTSTVFCRAIDWSKLDSASFSWQKGLGGEAGLGTIVLSPAAIERLENYIPAWPIPRLYKLAQNKIINQGIFEGKTINTPSMLCIEDFINSLEWADTQGGLDFLVNKTNENYNTVKNWIMNQNTLDFTVKNELERARNVICLDITLNKYQTLSTSQKWDFLKHIVQKMEEEQLAYDILGHILEEPNIRFWTGPTIKSEDLLIALNGLNAAVNCFI